LFVLLLTRQTTHQLFLNDWGCATEVAKSVRFSGALQHAPPHVIECWAQESSYEPRFSDDLEMVVRSVFHSLSVTTFEQIRLEQLDVGKIISFWKHHLAPPIWSDMLAAARHEDYAGLKMRIRNLLPGAASAPAPATPDSASEGNSEDEGDFLSQLSVEDGRRWCCHQRFSRCASPAALELRP
jgi:hypothetical protein